MDPLEDGADIEEWLSNVLGTGGGPEALPFSGLAERVAAVAGLDAGSVAAGLTSIGRSLGAKALEVEQRHIHEVQALLQTGCISYEEARRQLDLDGEENVARRGLAGRGRRKNDRAAIPPEAVPIAGFLRIHRDEAEMRTSVYHRNGSLLREYDDDVETRSIGQILVEDFVPMICSGCGETKGTSLCEECRQDIVNDLVRGLDHD